VTVDAYFQCENCRRTLGHILTKSSGVRRLEVYRNPLRNLTGPTVISIVAVIDAGQIHCQACGFVSEWHLDQRKVQEILEGHLQTSDS
jgi:hypothetical protein